MNTTVVIVDDDLDARRVIRKYIERHFPDFRILGEAGSVIDAVELIEETKPNILFLDIQLQDGTGFDVLDSLGTLAQEIGIRNYPCMVSFFPYFSIKLDSKSRNACQRESTSTPLPYLRA
ncbi:MAG: LytR/AlgR family response regulator transcription factor [Fluviicola sp.]